MRENRLPSAAMSNLPRALRAPFAEGGEQAIDAVMATRLLSAALDAGGDYADVYFEFRVAADYSLEEEQVKSVGRGVTMGLGVRVLKGDATGYAYTEDLDVQRMLHAAKIAGQIAATGGSKAPVAVPPLRRVPVADYYPVPTPSLMLAPTEKLALLRAADHAARGFDPRIIKVEASFS